MHVEIASLGSNEHLRLSGVGCFQEGSYIGRPMNTNGVSMTIAPMSLMDGVHQDWDREDLAQQILRRLQENIAWKERAWLQAEDGYAWKEEYDSWLEDVRLEEMILEGFPSFEGADGSVVSPRLARHLRRKILRSTCRRVNSVHRILPKERSRAPRPPLPKRVIEWRMRAVMGAPGKLGFPRPNGRIALRRRRYPEGYRRRRNRSKN